MNDPTDVRLKQSKVKKGLLQNMKQLKSHIEEIDRELDDVDCLSYNMLEEANKMISDLEGKAYLVSNELTDIVADALISLD